MTCLKPCKCSYCNFENIFNFCCTFSVNHKSRDIKRHAVGCKSSSNFLNDKYKLSWGRYYIWALLSFINHKILVLSGVTRKSQKEFTLILQYICHLNSWTKFSSTFSLVLFAVFDRLLPNVDFRQSNKGSRCVRCMGVSSHSSNTLGWQWTVH